MILVVASTGSLGMAVVKGLAAAHENVVAFVRDTSTMSRREGDSIETVDQMGVQNLIDAAEAAGTKHFIFVSFSRNIRNDFPLAAAKRAAERRCSGKRFRSAG